MGNRAQLVRHKISSKALADFIAKFTIPGNVENIWTVNTDGSSTQRGGGAGIIITSPEKNVLKYGVQLKFPVTNNEAEYETLLTGLRVARSLGAENVVLKSDSQLLIGQVRGEYEAQEARTQQYLKLTNQLISSFNYVEFVQIPRDQNAEADEVSRSASTDSKSKRFDWKTEEQNYPSIQELQAFSVHTERGWTSPIFTFLQEG